MEWVVMTNSGIGVSLDNTCWRDAMSELALAASKVQESFMRGGIKRARQKAESKKEERENTPEDISESIMP
jgi:hypothetical protein